MNKSQVFNALNGEIDGDRFRVECHEGRWVTLTLQRQGRTMQYRLEQEEVPASPDYWDTICPVSEFRDQLKSLKGKIQFSFKANGLVVGNGKGRFTINVPKNQDPLEFDPRDINATLRITLSGQDWENVQAAANVAVLNTDEKSVYAKYVLLSIQSGMVKVTALTPSLTYNHSHLDADIDPEIQVSLLISVNDIELISSFKPKAVFLTVGAEQAIADLDGNVLVAFPLGTDGYPYPKNLPMDSPVIVEVDKSTFEQAILEVLGKAKSLTLSIIDGKLFVKNGKKQAEIGQVANPDAKAVVKVGASALMYVLRAITMTQVHLLLFPGMSVGFEIASGAFYLLLGMTKTAIELTELDLEKTEPQRKIVEERPAIDGTITAIEAVEISPLTSDVTTPGVTEKLKAEAEKISQVAGDRIQELKEEIELINSQLEESRKVRQDTLKQDPRNPNPALKAEITDLANESDRLLIEQKNQKESELKALEKGKKKLDQTLEFDGKDLEAFVLNIMWTGGRVWELALRKKKTWQLEARVAIPA